MTLAQKIIIFNLSLCVAIWAFVLGWPPVYDWYYMRFVYKPPHSTPGRVIITEIGGGCDREHCFSSTSATVTNFTGLATSTISQSPGSIVCVNRQGYPVSVMGRSSRDRLDGPHCESSTAGTMTGYGTLTTTSAPTFIPHCDSVKAVFPCKTWDGFYDMGPTPSVSFSGSGQ